MYYQFQWNGNRYPAVGTYWSATNVFGRGAQPYFYNTNNPNIQGMGPESAGVTYTNKVPGYSNQYGFRLNWTPSNSPLAFSFYFLNYTDKTPVSESLATGNANWVYLKNRKLFGLSGNAPVGDWAFAWEASYRPHDAIALSSCYGTGGPTDALTNGVYGGDCNNWSDQKKIQVDVNGILALNPTTYPFIKLLGASAANLTLEATWIDYPGVHPNSMYYSTINGVSVYQVPDAAGATWILPGFGSE